MHDFAGRLTTYFKICVSISRRPSCRLHPRVASSSSSVKPGSDPNTKRRPGIQAMPIDMCTAAIGPTGSDSEAQAGPASARLKCRLGFGSGVARVMERRPLSKSQKQQISRSGKQRGKERSSGAPELRSQAEGAATWCSSPAVFRVPRLGFGTRQPGRIRLGPTRKQAGSWGRRHGPRLSRGKRREARRP